MVDDPFGGDDHVGWTCPRGHRNDAMQQTCECGCGTSMVDGTMILRDSETGEEYALGSR